MVESGKGSTYVMQEEEMPDVLHMNGRGEEVMINLLRGEEVKPFKSHDL